MSIQLTGTITRLIAPEGSFGERIFFRPDVGQEVQLSQLDGRHKAAYGAEVIVPAPIAGLKLGAPIRVELAGDALKVIANES